MGNDSALDCTQQLRTVALEPRSHHSRILIGFTTVDDVYDLSTHCPNWTNYLRIEQFGDSNFVTNRVSESGNYVDECGDWMRFSDLGDSDNGQLPGLTRAFSASIFVTNSCL